MNSHIIQSALKLALQALGAERVTLLLSDTGAPTDATPLSLSQLISNPGADALSSRCHGDYSAEVVMFGREHVVSECRAWSAVHYGA